MLSRTLYPNCLPSRSGTRRSGEYVISCSWFPAVRQRERQALSHPSRSILGWLPSWTTGTHTPGCPLACLYLPRWVAYDSPPPQPSPRLRHPFCLQFSRFWETSRQPRFTTLNFSETPAPEHWDRPIFLPCWSPAALRMQFHPSGLPPTLTAQLFPLNPHTVKNLT